MKWSEVDIAPSLRKLRQFAAIWLLFFGTLAVWQGFVRNHAIAAIVLGMLAVTVGPLGLIRPRAIRWVYVGWTIATFPIGWVISNVILGVMFYGIFAPVAVLFRVLGRDVLARRRPPRMDTFWTPKPSARDARDYLRQF